MATPFCNAFAKLSCETPQPSQPLADSPSSLGTPYDNFEVAFTKITPWSEITLRLRSVRHETLQRRHNLIRAAADRDRCKIALTNSKEFREALVKKIFRKRHRSGRPSKHDGVPSPRHPAVHRRQTAKSRSQNLPPPPPKVQSFKATRRSRPFNEEEDTDPFMLFPEWDWPVSPLKADSARYHTEAHDAIDAANHVRSKRSRFDASPTFADKLRVIEATYKPLSPSDTPQCSPSKGRMDISPQAMDLSW